MGDGDDGHGTTSTFGFDLIQRSLNVQRSGNLTLIVLGTQRRSVRCERTHKELREPGLERRPPCGRDDA